MKTVGHQTRNNLIGTIFLLVTLIGFPYSVPARSETTLGRHQAMSKINQLSQPIEDHRYLNPLAGDWRGEGVIRILPELDFEPITCRLVARWVLGERFLEQTLKCVADGLKYEGQGFLGFDRIAERYIGTWIDKANTGYTAIEGRRVNEATLELTLSHNHPLTMEKETMAATLTISNPYSYTYSATVLDKKTGKSVLLQKIIYTK